MLFFSHTTHCASVGHNKNAHFSERDIVSRPKIVHASRTNKIGYIAPEIEENIFLYMITFQHQGIRKRSRNCWSQLWRINFCIWIFIPLIIENCITFVAVLLTKEKVQVFSTGGACLKQHKHRTYCRYL